MRFYRPLAKGRPYLCITEKTAQGEETNTYQLRLVDETGRLYMAIDDFQMVQVDRLSEEKSNIASPANWRRPARLIK